MNHLGFPIFKMEMGSLLAASTFGGHWEGQIRWGTGNYFEQCAALCRQNWQSITTPGENKRAQT